MLISSGEVLKRHLREFAAWKLRESLTGPESIQDEEYSGLNPMVAHIIRGYLEHGDLATALDLMGSAQYSETVPPLDLIKCLLRGLAETTIDPLLRRQVFAHLASKIDSGQWDDLVMQLLRCNFLEETGASPISTTLVGANGFWEVLRILLEDMAVCPTARLELAKFVARLWRRAVLRRTLAPLIAEALDDRRLRRRFISMHLYGLVRILSPTECGVGAELISLALGGLLDHPEEYYYGCFLEECYEFTLHLETEQVFQLLSDLSWLPRVEIVLLLLERRFRLGGGDKTRGLPQISRIREVLNNLCGVRVQDRSGISHNVDTLIFRLLRILLVGFILGCQYGGRTFQGGPSSGSSLLEPVEMVRLLDDVRRLANSVEWPGAIRVMLRTTLRCMEAFCPDCVIVL